MFVFDTTMLKCEGYSDKKDFFNNNDRKGSASIWFCDLDISEAVVKRAVKRELFITLPVS